MKSGAFFSPPTFIRLGANVRDIGGPHAGVHWLLKHLSLYFQKRTRQTIPDKLALIDKNDDTLGDMEAKAMVDILADTIAEIEAETLGETLGDVETEALVDTLPDTVT